MSVQYLIDLFAPVTATARILDVSDPPTFSTLINGAFVVRIPPNVAVPNPGLPPPPDLDSFPINSQTPSLIPQKYAGLMAANAGFTRMAFDPLLDASNIDTGVSKGIFGQRGTSSIFPGAFLQSTVVPLTGPTATQCFITWEVFQYNDNDPSFDRFQRNYFELPTAPYSTCQVSFNGGTSFLPVTDGSVLNIPNADQGANFIIQITNASGSRLSVGSWAILY